MARRSDPINRLDKHIMIRLTHKDFEELQAFSKKTDRAVGNIARNMIRACLNSQSLVFSQDSLIKGGES